MNQKTIKALCKINILLDKEQEKLSDKMKDLELSHNRKYKLLQDIETKIKFMTKYCIQEQYLKTELNNILFKINKELTFCGRVKGVF